MNINKWDGKVPDWELEPIGTEQKEAQESGAEKTPSIVEERIAEIAKEAKVVAPEDPKKKDAEIEKIRAEIIGLSIEEAEAIVNETTSETMRRLNQNKRMDEIKQFEQVNQEPESIRIEALKNKEKTTLLDDFDIVNDTISRFNKRYGEMLDNRDKFTDEDFDEMEDILEDLRKQQKEMGGLMEIDSRQKELQKLEETLMERNAQNTRASRNPDKEAFVHTKDLEDQIFNLREKIENIKKATKYVAKEENKDSNEPGGVKVEVTDIQAEGTENHDNLTEELKNEYTIRNVYDFNSLMKAIDKVGDITGSDGYVYKPDYLKDVIDEIFMGRKQLNYVTSTFGLRDKVRSLIEAQQSEMDRRNAEQSKSPEEKMKDKIFESEDLKRLREYQESVKKVEHKEKESRSMLR